MSVSVCVCVPHSPLRTHTYRHSFTPRYVYIASHAHSYIPNSTTTTAAVLVMARTRCAHNYGVCERGRARMCGLSSMSVRMMYDVYVRCMMYDV